MKAFDHYGGTCNGCGEYAEFCACTVDNEGNLIEVRNTPVKSPTKMSYPDGGEYGYDED